MPERYESVSLNPDNRIIISSVTLLLSYHHADQSVFSIFIIAKYNVVGV